MKSSQPGFESLKPKVEVHGGTVASLLEDTSSSPSAAIPNTAVSRKPNERWKVGIGPY